MKREFFESFKGVGPKIAIQLAKTVRVVDAIISPENIPETITVSGRKMKVALPEEMEERLSALKVIPRAGKLRELIDMSFEIETIEELEEAIAECCKKSIAAKIKSLLYHGYDGDE